jgi:chemotaxis protein methyltransferase WspC
MVTLPAAALREIIALLEARIGLNAESIGRQTLEQAIQLRQTALNVTDATEYVLRLRTSAEEWQAFVEEMIVPESWFFRESTPFECVRTFMQQDSRPRQPRILSIPCSRGEEPYSLAMTMLDLGLLPMQFEILACDLSLKSLDFARRGKYRNIAFREQDANSLRLTQRYFTPLQDEQEIQASVRGAVKFRHANLASADFLKEEAPFDIIFCRNVLIYLTEPARKNAFAHFRRLLAPGGLLYLGHSECRLGPQAGCTSWNARFPAAFTWQTLAATHNASATKPITHYSPVNRNSHVQLKRPAMHQSPSHEKPTVAPVARTVTLHAQESILERAKMAANAGKLHEAESLCHAWMQQAPPDPTAFCLLGVIHQSRGDHHVAEMYYQKALFIAPDHEESLTHMLLLSQLRGDATQIANYQRRLTRRQKAELS